MSAQHTTGKFTGETAQRPLDPTLAEYLRSTAEAGRRAPSDGTVEAARGQLASRAAAAPAGRLLPSVVDHEVVTPDRTIHVRSYAPDQASASILYLHGGGWVIGDVQSFDRVARELAHATGARVISVDYRLAPEDPFPAGLEDAWAALHWVSETFPLEPLVIAGDSAGANLAAVLAQRARTSGPGIAAQILVYPVTDHDLNRRSYYEYEEGHYLLTRRDMAWFWDHYLPDAGQRSNPEVAPLRNPDLSGLPPAIIVVAGHDPLRDEVHEYATQLVAAGGAVRIKEYPSMGHGFISLIGVVDEASAVFLDLAGELGRILRPE